MTTKISGSNGITFPDNDQQNSVVGTVSQVGGAPTGAIIESGSNANGRYIKFADGTMICRALVRLNTVLSPSPPILGATWTFPAEFIDTTTIVTHTPMQGSSADATPAINLRMNPAATVPATANVSLRVMSTSTAWASGDFVDTNAIAIGRWF
jgi:hypothetical protein